MLGKHLTPELCHLCQISHRKGKMGRRLTECSCVSWESVLCSSLELESKLGGAGAVRRQSRRTSEFEANLV